MDARLTTENDLTRVIEADRAMLHHLSQHQQFITGADPKIHRRSKACVSGTKKASNTLMRLLVAFGQ